MSMYVSIYLFNLTYYKHFPSFLNIFKNRILKIVQYFIVLMHCYFLKPIS